MFVVKVLSAFSRLRGAWVSLWVVASLATLLLTGCNRPSGPSPLDADQEQDQQIFAGLVAGFHGQVEVAEMEKDGKVWKLSEETSMRVMEILRTQRPAGFEGGRPAYKLELHLPNPQGVPGSSVVRLKRSGSKLAFGSYLFEVDGMGELRRLIRKPK